MAIVLQVTEEGSWSWSWSMSRSRRGTVNGSTASEALTHSVIIEDAEAIVASSTTLAVRIKRLSLRECISLTFTFYQTYM